MPEAMQRALMLEIGMQNAGLGASLAVSLFPSQPGVALPCGLYAFGCMLTGTMLAQWLSRRPLSV
jgi:BASS family bile acid:Na+ symporter